MEKEELFLKLTKLGLLLSFFTPLVLGPFGITLSAYPKAVFFRTVIDIAFIFYLILLYFNLKYLPKMSFLTMAILFFNGILILSTILGINPLRSIIGTQDRGEGAILHIHFLLFFLMAVGVFQTKKEWFKILKLAFIVASLSSSAGILQKVFYPNFFRFYGNSLPERISGTLANPDFFGAYMSLSVFLGFLIFLLEKEKDFKLVWLFLIALNFFTLVMSHTRAAWGGLTIGLFIFFILLSSKYSNLNPKKKKLILVSTLILFFIGVFMVLNYQRFNLDRFYYFNRFLSAFNVKTLAPRISVWQIAIESWKERPILGWGPESFGYLFDKHFKAEYLPHTRGFYFDYPHNKFLGILSDAGILGLLGYLSIFVAAFYLIFKNNKNTHQEHNSPIIKFLLLSFLVAYLIQNIFAFDTIAIYFLLFLMLGFINNNFTPLEDIKQEENKNKAFSRLSGFIPLAIKKNIKIILIVFFVSLSLISLYQINIKPTIASVKYVATIRSGSPDFGEVLAGLKKSISFNTVFDKDIEFEIIKTLLSYNVSSIKEEKTRQEAMNFLLDLRKSLEDRIKKPETRYITAHELLAKIDEIQYLSTKNPALLSSMESTLEKAISFNNQQPELYRLMGEKKILQKNYKEGEDYFTMAFELGFKGPNEQIEFYKNLGNAYYLEGNNQKAVENFKKAIDLYFSSYKTDPNLFSPSFRESQDQVLLWDWTAMIYFKELKKPEIAYEIYEMAMEFFPKYKNDLKMRLDSLKVQ